MEKLKALIAVALFIAALLFAVGNDSAEQQNSQSKASQTVVIDNK